MQGVSFTENNNDWHHNILTKNYDLAVEELNNAKDKFDIFLEGEVVKFSYFGNCKKL